MLPSPQQTTLTVALIGNPNTGKSTIFSDLVGVRQRVGNDPGGTVEKKTGDMEYEGRRYELIDLPGLYSLAPRSRDEMIAVDLLLGRRADLPPIDIVVCIADASNLERNLYLVSQVLELGLPTVLALNMVDVAKDHGISVDVEQIERQLGIAVVPTQANRRIGIAQLKMAMVQAARNPATSRGTVFPEAFEEEVTRLESLLAGWCGDERREPLPRWLARRLLLDVNGYLEKTLLTDGKSKLGSELQAARARLAGLGLEVPAVETAARYDWVRQILEGILTHPSRYKVTATDRIDRVLTHRIWGMLVFAALMVIIFQSVFSWALPLMDVIDQAFAALGGSVERHMAEGALRSLLVNGIIGGVGAVATFLPQILILFLFIAILEDCGYMARAACLMDRTMVRVGLSGKSFIPMLSSFACAVPGIMATRVIANERDRLTTILVAPLMTCSARLPVYALLIAAFIPSGEEYTWFGVFNLQGLTLLGLYVLGIIAAVGVALVLKKTILRGETPLFLMELPSYKWPSPRTVFFRVWERGWVFVHTAGTIILAFSILAWGLLYYPHNPQVVEDSFRPQKQQLQSRLEGLQAELARTDTGNVRREETAGELDAIEKKLAEVDRKIVRARQRQSWLGRLGRLVEPAVKPLGWDWRIGCAVIASFPAREVVVATLGVMYDPGDQVDEESKQFRKKLRNATWDGTDQPVFNIPVALSIMVFFALCAQCAATLAVIRRETNSWWWPVFTFSYMTGLAYLGALITYQVGIRLAELS